jgi:hypothetical protein
MALLIACCKPPLRLFHIVKLVIYVNYGSNHTLPFYFQVEQLEQDISELKQALSDKEEQEQAMFQVPLVPVYSSKATSYYDIFPNLESLAEGPDACRTRTENCRGSSDLCRAGCCCPEICC